LHRHVVGTIGCKIGPFFHFLYKKSPILVGLVCRRDPRMRGGLLIVANVG